MDINLIEKFHPCQEARDWLTTQSSPEEAWKTCVRGDWLDWLIRQTQNDKLIQACNEAKKAYNEAHNQSRETWCKAYNEAYGPAWEAFVEAEVRSKASNEAWKAFDRAFDEVRKAYLLASDGMDRKVWADDIRKAVKFEDVLEAIG